MKKIGIFAARRQYASRVYNDLDRAYVASFEQVGAIIILIPLFTKYFAPYIDKCDGFVIPGGPDICPSFYGQHIAGATGMVREYDQFLIDGVHKVFETKKPLLGICKGMQLLNVIHGGTLKQHVEHADFHRQDERCCEEVDTLDIIYEDSFLGKLYKNEPLRVNSIHHQAVDMLGTDLRIVARSQFDGEIEAIEHTSLPYYGVQWHPEYLPSTRLFAYFVEQCG